MAKKVYYGVETEVPVYEGDYAILNTDTLLKGKFTFSGVDSSTDSFTLSTSGIFTSNNDGAYTEEEEGVSAWMRWDPKQSISNLSFDWKVSSEENFDILYIYKNSTLLVEASGEQNGTIGPLNLTTNDYLTFKYTKDSSNDHGTDTATISNVKIDARVQVGTEIKSVAKKVTNLYLGIENVAKQVICGYIGIGGLARPFWSGPELQFYGRLSNLSTATQDLIGVSMNDSALFGGGSTPGDYNAIVYRYDNNLTRSNLSTSETFWQPSGATATPWGSVYLGDPYGGTQQKGYNLDYTRFILTNPADQTFLSPGVASIGQYAISGGGRRRPGNINTTTYYANHIFAWNENYTGQLLPFTLTIATSSPRGANNNKYAFIGGGVMNTTSEVSPYAPHMRSIDSYLTVRSVDNLSTGRRVAGGTNFGKYAVFCGGTFYGTNASGNTYTAYSSQIDAYDEDLVHTVYSMTYNREYAAPVGLISNLVICGGCAVNDQYSNSGKDADVFNRDFSRTLITDLTSERLIDQGYANCNNYALYVGGATYSESGNTGYHTSSNIVYAFKE